MNDPLSQFDQGPYDPRYRAFLETVVSLRPKLHRYCSRMTGSTVDGEDIAQEALFEAFRKLDQFDESRPLGPWIYRIAHNRCIDLFRRRGVRQEAETEAYEAYEESAGPAEPATADVPPAIERLVLCLPPKERACILLKDVLDCSLEETAQIVDSTVGGVKAALVRGRTKLGSAQPTPGADRSIDPQLSRIVALYVSHFNRRDWSGLRDLISADARLRVSDRYGGRLLDSPYFGVYDKWPTPWRMLAGELEGEPCVVISEPDGQGWKPISIVRLTLAEGRIAGIADYYPCRWLLEGAPLVVK